MKHAIIPLDATFHLYQPCFMGLQEMNAISKGSPTRNRRAHLISVLNGVGLGEPIRAHMKRAAGSLSAALRGKRSKLAAFAKPFAIELGTNTWKLLFHCDLMLFNWQTQKWKQFESREGTWWDICGWFYLSLTWSNYKCNYNKYPDFLVLKKNTNASILQTEI